MFYLVNAFSLNMLTSDANLLVHQVDEKIAAELAEVCISAVGHADTARVFSNVLGVPVVCNRTNVTLEKGGLALVGQYSGPRLPEGATTLPEGASIKWLVVGVKYV